jgi:hypothetical protein
MTYKTNTTLKTKTMSSANLHQGGRDGWIEGGGTEEGREGGIPCLTLKKHQSA